MSEYVSRPNLPGYVSVKEAAKILGISDKRVYEYVNEGRLPSMWAADVIMIPLDEIQKFKRRTSGRPRRNIPVWRISSGENTHYMTSIVVQVRAGQHDALLEKLEEIRQRGEHLFPGTVARFITESEINPEQLEIVLIWRGTVMPKEAERERSLEVFQLALADVLDWSTAQHNNGRVLMHT
jgi:excisionase family DNA binding protein